MSKRLSIENFIERANNKHLFRYSYDKVTYLNNHQKVEIICKEHGVFLQAPVKHLAGRGCPSCAKVLRGMKKKLSHEKVEQVFTSVGYKLLEDYESSSKPLKYLCPKHPDKVNKISYSNLCNGHRCKWCSREKASEKQRTSYFEVKNTFKELGYQLVSEEYINNKAALKYICPKHGIREICYSDLLSGRSCALCNKTSKGEDYIYKFLESKNFAFKKEKSYDGLCSDKGRKLRFDFEVTVSDKKFLIEFHGEQHYKEVRLFGEQGRFERLLMHDTLKTKWCEENNIPLLIIKYTDYKRIPELITDFINGYFE